MARRFGIELEVTGGNCNMLQVAALIAAEGIKINVEGYNHTLRRAWKIVSDGSLRGTNMMELVSPPLKGKKGMAEVATVARVLSANAVTVNSSCGMHVHVDAVNMTAQNIKNAAKLFAIHEEHIKALLPQSRRITQWAKWPSDLRIGETVQARCDAINHTTTVLQLQTLWGRDRYRAINFESLSRHNTIEFRSHSGTVDATKIMAWVALCLGIVRNAQQNIDLGIKRPCGSNRQFTTLVRYAGQANVKYFFDRRVQFAADATAI